MLDAQGSAEDIVAGKGGSTIFLLHGPPGCGKTVTAEAIAEMLEMPLYVVTGGVEKDWGGNRIIRISLLLVAYQLPSFDAYSNGHQKGRATLKNVAKLISSAPCRDVVDA